jgi:hypothetical protein
MQTDTIKQVLARPNSGRHTVRGPILALFRKRAKTSHVREASYFQLVIDF